MASPTPFQLAKPPPTYRKVEHYGRDPYSFSSMSVSQGTNPVVLIPECGPHAAGAPPATLARQIVSVEVIASGSIAPTYGVNS